MDNILDDTSRNDILSVALSVFAQQLDHPTWINASNGNCSAAHAYEFLTEDVNDIKGWKWFWKMRIPQKFKTFLWLIFHDKLPTNCLHARRGITTLDTCPRCENSPETISHLFRECPKALALWDKIPSGPYHEKWN